MEGLNDKVIVFAGAGGIADGTAKFLGAGGAKIVVGDIVKENAERCVQIVKDAGGDGIAAALDIADEEQVKNLIDLAIAKFGKINGLFNVAANIHPQEVAKDTNPVDIDLDVWQRNIDINLTGYMLTSKYAIPHILKAGGGSIVNTISDAVYAGMPDKLTYSVTKAGIGALTRNIAARFGKQGIRCNAVSPGLVLTEAGLQNSGHLVEMVLQMMPAPRVGKPEDMGSMVSFLLSDLSEWITGQTICVDGGAVMRT
ncbi:SDR family NAD(P)-dependent oxidoreductase [Mangrovibacterium diazotrophicum]|uniref:NAD(P)-dependent dehydrogenase (Short-subunit alcohol dehydrogenase family) n=1 Tax=Mangrovibacterium diazotrophicum TaxID=1261403 RepID=A0A419W605_9BACT|nr:SDR family oxidoreductase [Mangrovibacterium diazotrophicum]RKD90874.1 NAD(P)-dependent dehydrogenase (short-subunit alcohol dehydrogenase family) [Mangrovibacterium diazotrophicum]